MEASFQLHVLASLMPENSLLQTFFISYCLAYVLLYSQDYAYLRVLTYPASDNLFGDVNPFLVLFPTSCKTFKILFELIFSGVTEFGHPLLCLLRHRVKRRAAAERTRNKTLLLSARGK
jgi:hypothetical protein